MKIIWSHARGCYEDAMRASLPRGVQAALLLSGDSGEAPRHLWRRNCDLLQAHGCERIKSSFTGELVIDDGHRVGTA